MHVAVRHSIKCQSPSALSETGSLVYSCTYQADWLMNFFLASLSQPPITLFEHWDCSKSMLPCLAVQTGSGDPNQGPRVCAASTVFMEPSPQA